MPAAVKPPPDRLYGRHKGKKLRPRQELLLAEFLPKLSWPDAPFGITPRETWLEVGFGGGEHAHALALANPDTGIIAAEVFENGICSLLSRLAPDETTLPEPPANLRLYTDDARPLLTFYGDDFTGSTDALEALARAGVRSALFLDAPASKPAWISCPARSSTSRTRSR